MSAPVDAVALITQIVPNVVTAAGILLYFKYRMDRSDGCLVRIENRLDKKIDAVDTKLEHVRDRVDTVADSFHKSAV